MQTRTPGLSGFEEKVGAADVALPAGDLREIDRAASQITVRGDRYPEHLERRTGL
jgi:hypothetical protein